ncbi:MAG: hypothetical protein LBQ59_00220 [Candidatus Peribacteria bacterium]|nr:hypothetical protein [Candidatus Peribacteria bacterium]
MFCCCHSFSYFCNQLSPQSSLTPLSILSHREEMRHKGKNPKPHLSTGKGKARKTSKRSCSFSPSMRGNTRGSCSYFPP